MSERATRDVPLGPCDCPGTPHAEGDVATLKKPSEIRYGDIRVVGAAMVGVEDPLDGGRAMPLLMLRMLVSWNKLREDPRGGGRPVVLPITIATIDDLAPGQAAALISVLNDNAYTRFFVGERGTADVAPEPVAGAPEASVQAFSGNGAGNGGADTLSGLELAAVTPPNPSSGSSPDGSAASTPSTTLSASPAPI